MGYGPLMYKEHKSLFEKHYFQMRPRWILIANPNTTNVLEGYFHKRSNGHVKVVYTSVSQLIVTSFCGKMHVHRMWFRATQWHISHMENLSLRDHSLKNQQNPVYVSSFKMKCQESVVRRLISLISFDPSKFECLCFQLCFEIVLKKWIEFHQTKALLQIYRFDNNMLIFTDVLNWLK